MEIDGCISIVTGGASGLGEACVRTMVEANGKAAIFDLDEKKGKKLLKSSKNRLFFVEQM
jgi:NAD(P)-dependent dehydrogenase (short-subunit alcohol dehydrogenase family)